MKDPHKTSLTPSRDIARLLDIMAALRTPGSGCPWDLEQTFESIAPYTIEEAYEVTDAIARGDHEDLRDELGDLLLQVVFHARMAEEHHRFDFGAVVEAITAKLLRRHPHVFGDVVACRRPRSTACGKPSRPTRRPSAVPAPLPPMARRGRQGHPMLGPRRAVSRRPAWRPGRPPGADPRPETAAEGQPGRL